MNTLRMLRSEHGLTQAKLAEYVGASRSSIALIECGINKPSVELAKKLAAVFNVNWTIFFE